MTDKETNCLITGGAVPAPDVQILKANINFSKNKPTTVVPKHSQALIKNKKITSFHKKNCLLRKDI